MKQISPPAARMPSTSDDETNAPPRCGQLHGHQHGGGEARVDRDAAHSGIGSECTSRSLIGVTAPIRTAISRTTPVNRKVTTTAVPNTSAYSRAGIAKSATRSG